MSGSERIAGDDGRNRPATQTMLAASSHELGDLTEAQALRSSTSTWSVSPSMRPDRGMAPPHYAFPMEKRTGFAPVGGSRVAYQVSGSGSLDLVGTPGSFVSFDITEEDPQGARYYRRFSSMGRVIRFDRLGAGASDPVPLDALPSVEAYADQTLAVMDTVGSERAALMAGYDAGPMAVLLAATHPERVSALVLVNTTARFLRDDDYEIGIDPGAAEQIAETFGDTWGSEAHAALYVPSRAGDAPFLSWFAKLQRLTISPSQAAAYLRGMFAVDVRALLPSITVPTLVLHRRRLAFIPLSHAEYLAEHIPNARLAVLEGSDAPLIWEGADQTLDAIEEFITGIRPATAPERAIASVLFTDIVDSTSTAEDLGDRRWREILDLHDDAATKAVAVNSGVLVKHTGDGFMATFDRPSAAVEAARTFSRRVSELGIPVRVGIHTGEVETGSDDVGGLAVHLAARVMAQAEAGEILVSRTVRDLMVGSSISFEDRGEVTLKGFEGTWRLYAVV
jgi:class 3 adenylate cyclase